MSLFRKKSIEHMLAGAQRAGLKKTLGALDLTFLGVGAIIGTGIFVLTGTGAVQAGPALMMSFILAAIAHATDDELDHIAAGPIEHLLGKHGVKYIEKVEKRAEADPKFARMLAGVWKYMMTDEVWARVEVLKAKYPAPAE